MKVKHWQGYGCVDMKKMPNEGATLHVRVSGNHEWGIHVNEWDDMTMYNWIVKRFDKKVPEYIKWHRMRPIIEVRDGWNAETDYCDYYFTYSYDGPEFCWI